MKKSHVKLFLKSNWEVTLSTNVVKTFQGMYLYMSNIFLIILEVQFTFIYL
jgi:hypothetical protein